MISKLQDSGSLTRSLQSKLDTDASRWEMQIFNRSNYWNEYVTLVKLFIRLFQLIHSDHCQVYFRLEIFIHDTFETLMTSRNLESLSSGDISFNIT